MESLERLLARWFGYSTAQHLLRRIVGTDYKILGAILALVVVTLLVLRYGR
jgi:hypothetical protein